MVVLKTFANDGDIWVFGYGSLMWNPGFEYLEVQQAKAFGVHRAPCIYSWVHRGTKQRPGIVLGLARGGACIGKAFKISSDNRDETLAYLRARELVTNVYLERLRPIVLASGTTVKAVTYIADADHEQYAGRLGHEALIAQIKGAVGKSGPNESYITDTTDHLREMGIKDGLMERITSELKGH
ncbi:MAG: gamma-glutamylcyclotransferase [Rhizobiaceae bacterium]|nr:gamma-glutamylcyclotransferase [Rhizobiaceae bacterium]